MHKRNIGTLLQLVSGLSAAAFLISVIADFLSYNEFATSAPFWVAVLVRAAQFLIPGAVLGLIGFYLKRKRSA